MDNGLDISVMDYCRYAQKLRDGKAGWEALRQKLMQTFKISEANREILRVHKVMHLSFV